jgi:hypothetical protein
MLALGAGLAAAALRDNPQLRLTADQQLARSILLEKDDLPRVSATWKGGIVKPTVEGDSCGGAKNSDLVLTARLRALHKRQWHDRQRRLGAANEQMVRLDDQRQPPAAVEVRCLRGSYSGSKSYTVASVSRLPLPRWASTPMRTGSSSTIQARRKGRQRGSSTTTRRQRRARRSKPLRRVCLSDRNEVKPIELELAKLLLARSTPPKIIGYQLVGANSPTAGSGYTFGPGLSLRPDKVHGRDNTGPSI